MIDRIINETCETLGVPELVNLLYVDFNNRYTNKLGSAQPRYNAVSRHLESALIQFSTQLWKLATEKQRHEVVVHETCHVVNNYLNGRYVKGHGREWAALMNRCGLPANRCHTVDRSALRQNRKRHHIQCHCPNGIYVTSNIITKIANGQRRRCNGCGFIVTFQELQIS